MENWVGWGKGRWTAGGQAVGGLERTGVEFEETDWGLYTLVVEFEGAWVVEGWLCWGSKGFLLRMPYCEQGNNGKRLQKMVAAQMLGGGQVG